MDFNKGRGSHLKQLRQNTVIDGGVGGFVPCDGAVQFRFFKQLTSKNRKRRRLRNEEACLSFAAHIIGAAAGRGEKLTAVGAASRNTRAD
jgi:hypothetical protein